MAPRKTPTKSLAKKTFQKLGWKSVLVLLACCAMIWIIVRSHQRPASSSAIEDWIRQQNFDPLRPFRSDFLRGTLVTIGQTRDRVAMASGEFLGGQTSAVSHASLPITTAQ